MLALQFFSQLTLQFTEIINKIFQNRQLLVIFPSFEQTFKLKGLEIFKYFVRNVDILKTLKSFKKDKRSPNEKL